MRARSNQGTEGKYNKPKLGNGTLFEQVEAQERMIAEGLVQPVNEQDKAFTSESVAGKKTLVSEIGVRPLKDTKGGAPKNLGPVAQGSTLLATVDPDEKLNGAVQPDLRKAALADMSAPAFTSPKAHAKTLVHEIAKRPAAPGKDEPGGAPKQFVPVQGETLLGSLDPHSKLNGRLQPGSVRERLEDTNSAAFTKANGKTLVNAISARGPVLGLDQKGGAPKHRSHGGTEPLISSQDLKGPSMFEQNSLLAQVSNQGNGDSQTRVSRSRTTGGSERKKSTSRHRSTHSSPKAIDQGHPMPHPPKSPSTGSRNTLVGVIDDQQQMRASRSLSASSKSAGRPGHRSSTEPLVRL